MTYKQKTLPQRVKFAREAGAVRRLHVHRVIGGYDIAQHTFNALCLLRLLNEEADRELFWALLVHDLPERLTGDIPAPVKWVGGWFNRDQYEEIEKSILQGIGFGSDFKLSEKNQMWLKFIDACEFYMTCLDQEMLGNQTLWRPKELIYQYIESHSDDWPEKCWKFWQDLKKDNWLMCEEIGEQDE